MFARFNTVVDKRLICMQCADRSVQEYASGRISNGSGIAVVRFRCLRCGHDWNHDIPVDVYDCGREAIFEYIFASDDEKDRRALVKALSKS